jgi:DGQHR domain-containing protein
MAKSDSVQKISVIVPKSPFIRSSKLRDVKHCLAALDVRKLMEWWPGQPHAPHRDPKKVRAIQRSLDWKRVAQIAAYLLQKEIIDVPDQLDKFFTKIYEPKQLEPGREWPPKVSQVVGFERSEYPTFSNVLLHVNGASVEPIDDGSAGTDGAANLVFDEADKDLHFSVIDGQHRINGAYFAVCLLSEGNQETKWEIPAEIFIDLDTLGTPPRHQAQIFIDVNFYQKKVDRSLVADLFPTARGQRGALDDKERAQDIGRKLMLEIGPLKGMIQIPGIKFGVKDVVTLATLNSAIEDVLESLDKAGIGSLEEQTEFIAQCLEAWLEASGRKEEISSSETLDSNNVVYQGRVLVSALTLLPACVNAIRRKRISLTSDRAGVLLTTWFRGVMKKAALLKNGRFISKSDFRKKGYLGSGGIGRFRDTLWAAIGTRSVGRLSPESRADLANSHRQIAYSELNRK